MVLAHVEVTRHARLEALRVLVDVNFARFCARCASAHACIGTAVGRVDHKTRAAVVIRRPGCASRFSCGICAAQYPERSGLPSFVLGALNVFACSRAHASTASGLLSGQTEPCVGGTDGIVLAGCERWTHEQGCSNGHRGDAVESIAHLPSERETS